MFRDGFRISLVSLITSCKRLNSLPAVVFCITFNADQDDDDDVSVVDDKVMHVERLNRRKVNFICFHVHGVPCF
jgi:hypothetical protein